MISNLTQLGIRITKPLHQDIYNTAERYAVELDEAYETIQGLSAQIEHDWDTISDQKKTIAELEEKVEEVKNAKKQTPIDAHLSKEYAEIANIAYKNKRGEQSYAVFLNEMIRPDAFEVINYKLRFNNQRSVWAKMNAMTKNIAKTTTWVSEPDLYKSGDYYLYPSETLITKRDTVDCEDLSFLITSLDADSCATAYGFYNNGTERFGHAFPVWLYRGQLYIIETTGDSADMYRFPNAKYEVHYFITKNHTYMVKGGVRFGEIAHFEFS